MEQEKALAKYVVTEEDFKAYEDSDVPIAVGYFVRIRQKPIVEGDQVVAKAGGFTTLNKPDVDSMRIIFLASKRTRTYWGEKFGESRVPKCRSYDLIKGEGDPGIFCADCLKKEWIAGQAPKCPTSLNLFCLDEEFRPFVLQLNLMSTVPTRTYTRVLLREEGVKPYAFWTKITSNNVKEGPKNYYVINYEKQEALTDEQFQIVFKIRTELLKTLEIILKTVSEEPAETSSEEENDKGLQVEKEAVTESVKSEEVKNSQEKQSVKDIFEILKARSKQKEEANG